MNFSRPDLLHLRWSLLTFLVVLAIGACAVYLSREIADAALRDKRTAQQQLAEARNKLNAAREDRDNLSAYAAEYDTLVKHRVIGDEQRLDLLEGLEALRKQGRVLDFKYTIAPQAPYTPVAALDSGNFEFRQSSMNLQIDLLHEQQLINLLDGLRDDMNGWFMLDQCALERTPATGVSTAQLKATCSGSWLTLKHRTAK